MVALSPLAYFLPTLLSALTPNDTHTIFADETGQAHLVRTDIVPLNFVEVVGVHSDLDKIIFTLHTRENPTGEVLIPGDLKLSKKTTFNPNRPTRIITHGWRGDRTTLSCTLTRDAYLTAGDYNVIVMDWSVIASSLMYNHVANTVPIVGEYLGQFIDFLESVVKLNPDTTKLIGHSLGAHLVSLGANAARSRISEVVALDPAKPTFEGAGPDRRVDPSHAKNVQVIHTNAGRLGMTKQVGTSDFYPNGGSNQPGCPFYDVVGACAHQRSYKYYAESVLKPNGFLGMPKTVSASNLLSNALTAYMGGPNLDPAAKGAYSLETASEEPFALG